MLLGLGASLQRSEVVERARIMMNGESGEEPGGEESGGNTGGGDTPGGNGGGGNGGGGNGGDIPYTE